jgi:DNA-binding NarL/FixJ family response regulator
MSDTRRPKVLLADDYAPLLLSWRRILDQSCDIVGALSDGREAIAAALADAPDVVVLDIAMPEVNGLVVCRQIKAALPAVGVVLASAFDDAAFQQAAEAAGAAAFVVKSAAADELEAAVWQAFRGGTPFRVYSRRGPR